jgi:hypothetical protein
MTRRRPLGVSHLHSRRERRRRPSGRALGAGGTSFSARTYRVKRHARRTSNGETRGAKGSIPDRASSREDLVEPVMREGLVVERRHLDIARGAIQRDRLGQRVVGLQACR